MLRQTALALSALACGTGPQKVVEPAVPVEYWDLSTGSHIAYFHVPAAARKTRAAVVFVHGGPGAYQVASYDVGKEWYAHLAQLGFAIYAYDQVGSGLSGRLADPAEYSVSRHVADLAAIVQKIGAQRLVLIGDSWGATLVAHYIAAHPGTVTKAIFTSPGALDPADWNAPSETPRLDRAFLQWLTRTPGTDVVRYAELDRLLARDVRAAHAFAGDQEMDSLFSAFLTAEMLPRAVANRQKLAAAGLELHGMGWWAGVMTSWDAINRRPPAKPLLVTCAVPVLIIRGDADYIPLPSAQEYQRSFPHATFIQVPDAGHFIWLDQPEAYGRAIESFLLTDPAG